jgi:hypothetical protein
MSAHHRLLEYRARASLQSHGWCMTSLGEDLLADEKHVYGAQVEIVVEGEGRKAIVRRVLSGIELCGKEVNSKRPCRCVNAPVVQLGSRTMTVLPLY